MNQHSLLENAYSNSRKHLPSILFLIFALFSLINCNAPITSVQLVSDKQIADNIVGMWSNEPDDSANFIYRRLWFGEDGSGQIDCALFISESDGKGRFVPLLREDFQWAVFNRIIIFRQRVTQNLDPKKANQFSISRDINSHELVTKLSSRTLKMRNSDGVICIYNKYNVTNGMSPNDRPTAIHRITHHFDARFLAGLWEGITDDHTLWQFKFQPGTGAQIMINGEPLVTLDHNGQALKFVIDASKSPMWIDFISCDSNGKELGRFRSIVQIILSNKIRISIGKDAASRPSGFNGPDSWKTLILNQIK